MPYERMHGHEHEHRRGHGHRRGHAHGRWRRDRGQVAIEYLGFIPVLLLVALAAIQIGLVAYAAQQAGTAARAGARAASLRQSAQQACAEAVSSWLANGTTCVPSAGGDTVTVTATVHIPSIIPVWNPVGDAHKRATMPLDH
jgi:Flp pilus assembly protein TadG